MADKPKIHTTLAKLTADGAGPPQAPTIRLYGRS